MYCNIQNKCKLLAQATAQYNEVVKQNTDLQTDCRKTEEKLNKMRNAFVTILESLYESFADFWDEDLRQQVELLLMQEKEQCK